MIMMGKSVRQMWVKTKGILVEIVNLKNLDCPKIAVIILNFEQYSNASKWSWQNDKTV